MPNEIDDQRVESKKSSVRGWEKLETSAVERLENLAESRLGRTLAGRFFLNKIIAIGGMATVYAATQSPLMRRVAVKVLHPAEVEAGRTDFFLREANAASNLRHPNIISIVDFGQEEDGTLFLAMEYVPGIDLGVLLTQDGRLEIPRLLHISEQVCLALEVAHRAGVVHCDVKPSNIMIESVAGNTDYVKVLDFGISRVLNDENTSGLGTKDAPSDAQPLLGSFSFMAPEQILGRPILPQTDIYGIGVLMYIALTGQFPYLGETDQDLLSAVVNDNPRSIDDALPEVEVPSELIAIIQRAMAKNPAERFASAAGMRRELMELSRNYRDHFHSSSSLDEDALEVLFPETELLEVDIEEAVSSDGIENPWDTYSDVVHLSQTDLEAQTGAEQGKRDLVELIKVSTGDFQKESLNQFEGRPGHPPLVGRREQLKQLWQAIQRTQHNSVAVWLCGAYGSGRSFFLNRALKLLERETGAIVMVCNQEAGDRERPYHALYRWLKDALAVMHSHFAHDDGFETGDFPFSQASEPSADEDEIYTSAPSQPDAGLSLPLPTPPPVPVRTKENYHRLDLFSLGLGQLETTILESLLRRWDEEYKQTRNDPWSETNRPFDGGPLRFPETRRHLLRFAFDALLRRIAAVLQEKNPHRSEPVPIILAIDGWEHIDGPTHRIIRQILQDGQNLPLLLLLSHNADTSRMSDELPEDSSGERNAPDNQAPDWCDLQLHLHDLTRDELEEFITLELGVTPDKKFIDRLHEVSNGNPLFVRELLHLLTSSAPQPPGTSARLLRPIFDLPDDLARLFKLQLNDLSKDGKQLLAICALIGLTFPKPLLQATLPGEFDIDGALAELVGVRILEPHKGRDEYLRFRMPQMRKLVLRRLYPGQAAVLHERVAKLLRTRRFSMQRGEAEMLQAVHMVRGGDPIKGIDHLLDTADHALKRWEPELALRRFRQAQLWIAERMAQAQGSDGEILVLGSPDSIDPDDPSEQEPPLLLEDLEKRAVRATTGLLHAARRLLLHPARQSDAIIPERLPQQFLERITSNNFTGLSVILLSEAALEVGKYLACQGLPHSARAALQTALVYAREHGSMPLLIEIELHLAKSLHLLGHLGRATDLANDALGHIRELGPPPPLAQVRYDFHGSQPLDLLAKVCTAQRLHPRAEHYLDQSRALAEADGEIDRLHEIYLHYGQLYHAQSQLGRTLRALELALDAANKTNNVRAQARSLYNLGVTSSMAGMRTEARRHLNHALLIANALAWNDFVALIDEQLRRLN